MRVVFMGTSQLAASILGKLACAHEVVASFTRPDAVRGRGKKLVASAVKDKSLDLGIPVHTPKSLKDDEALETLVSLNPDVICVASYGCLLPKAVLDLPPFGCLNVHTSLLPRWRGAAPIERAILAGDEQTGVCIMRMEEGLDTGPYCVRETVDVGGRYLDELTDLLAKVGSGALIEALSLLEARQATWHVQEDGEAVYAEKITKGELDFGPEDATIAACARVRAANDSHPSKVQVAGRKLSVERACVVDLAQLPEACNLKLGQVALISKRLLICASDGIIELERVKPDGKKSMEGRAFAAGLQGLKNGTLTWERV